MMKLMKHIAILAAVASASLAMAEGPDGRGEHRGRGLRTPEHRSAPASARGGEERIARLEAMVGKLVGEVRSLRGELAKAKSAPRTTDRAPQRGHDRKPGPQAKGYEAHRAEMMKRIHEKMAAMKKGGHGKPQAKSGCKCGGKCPKCAAKKAAPTKGCSKASAGREEMMKVGMKLREAVAAGKLSPEQARKKMQGYMKSRGHGQQQAGAKKPDQKYAPEMLKKMLIAAHASPQARERVIAAAKKDPVLAKKLGWMKQQRNSEFFGPLEDGGEPGFIRELSEDIRVEQKPLEPKFLDRPRHFVEGRLDLR